MAQAAVVDASAAVARNNAVADQSKNTGAAASATAGTAAATGATAFWSTVCPANQLAGARAGAGGFAEGHAASHQVARGVQLE